MIEELASKADVILIQVYLMISNIYCGTGKAVDTGDPILPIQMSRRYGGVGLLWKKEIDHLIQVQKDGETEFSALRTESAYAYIGVYAL